MQNDNAGLYNKFSNECSDFLLGKSFNKTPLKAFYLFSEPSSHYFLPPKSKTYLL